MCRQNVENFPINKLFSLGKHSSKYKFEGLFPAPDNQSFKYQVLKSFVQSYCTSHFRNTTSGDFEHEDSNLILKLFKLLGAN